LVTNGRKWDRILVVGDQTATKPSHGRAAEGLHHNDFGCSGPPIAAAISRLLDKLGMNNRTQVALLAQQAGL
jgi:hypothetical protein